MGDYTKLIVHCEVDCSKEALEKRLEELNLLDSAYHCDGCVMHIEENFRKEIYNITIIGQTKYARGQSEFIDWLRPYVKQGSGPADIFAIQFDEYNKEPCLHHLLTQRQYEEIE